MKAKKLVGLLALASCVMLAGCGEKPEIVIKDLPTEFILGQEIDLDKYVSFGKDNAYRIVPSEESAGKLDISGHKITVISEEEVKDIKLKIVAGESEKDVSFDAVAGIRGEIAEFIKDVGYDYAAFDWYESEDGSGYEIGGGYYHNKNYVSMDWFGVEDDEETPIPGGFIQLSNGVYQFMFDGDEFVVEPGLVSDKTLLGYNGELKFDLSKLEYTPYKDDEGNLYECLTLKKDKEGSLLNFLSQTVLYQEYVEYYDAYFVPEYVEFEFDELEYDDGSKEKQLFAYVYVTVEGEGDPFFWSMHSFSKDKELCVIPELDEYIAAGNLPANPDYQDLKDELDSVFEAGNFSVDVDYSWINSKGQVIECPDFTGTFLQGCEDCFVNNSVSLRVTEDAAIKFQENNGDGDAYTFANGVFEKNGVVYDYFRKSATEASVTPNDKYESMADVYKEKGYFIFDHSNKDNYPADLFFYSAYDEDYKETYWMFNIIRYENFFKAVLDYTPDLGTVDPEAIASFKDLFDYFENVLDKDPSVGLEDYNFYNFFQSYASLGDGYIDFMFMFGWTDDAMYQISVEISNVGTTEIPEDIASQLVVSAE